MLEIKRCHNEQFRGQANKISIRIFQAKSVASARIPVKKAKDALTSSASSSSAAAASKKSSNAARKVRFEAAHASPASSTQVWSNDERMISYEHSALM